MLRRIDQLDRVNIASQFLKRLSRDDVPITFKDGSYKVVRP